MKLIDLEPVWLSPDVFMFKNPTGGKNWLTVKRVVMSRRDQHKLIYEANSQHVGKSIISCKADTAWKFVGNDFNTMTVTPSLDASASGNWHGHITNGQIVGGI